VKTLAGVDTNRVGLLGFSLGGHLCLQVRSTSKVLVEFFAPLLDGIGTGGGPGLRAQIHHGTGDSLVPFESNATPIEQELSKGGASTEVNDYRGAGHGFVGTDRREHECAVAVESAHNRVFRVESLKAQRLSYERPIIQEHASDPGGGTRTACCST